MSSILQKIVKKSRLLWRKASFVTKKFNIEHTFQPYNNFFSRHCFSTRLKTSPPKSEINRKGLY